MIKDGPIETMVKDGPLAAMMHEEPSGYCACCQRMMERLSHCPFMSCVALLLAALMAVRLIIKLVSCLCTVTRRFIFGRNLTRYGEWAVITGASDGIGKATAVQLAKKGYKKFLFIARNEQKLKDTATELELVSPSGITVSSLVIDFATESSETIFNKVSDAVKDLSVGILVNNVGISYPHAMYYDELSLSLLDELINVNVRAGLVVTRAVLPGMKARKQGMIVCVGSGASQVPSDPLYAAYAATKAASEAFCRSLQVEAAPYGIDVQCHVPLLVTTKLSKCKTPGLMTPTTKTYAEAAVATMSGASYCRSPVISPYYVHAFILWLAHWMPRTTWDKIRFGQVKSIRNRALKKKEDQKKDT